MRILIDTCVLMDMVDKNRARGLKGRQLYEFLIKMDSKLEILGHTFFELAAALKNSRTNGINYDFHSDFNLHILPISIDEAFMIKYLNKGILKNLFQERF